MRFATPPRVVLMAWIAATLAGCSKGPPIPVQTVAAAKVPASEELTLATPADTDWPWWRGPQFNGKGTADDLPTTWSETENVIWKTDVPGRGHSSATVCGDRILLATADEKAQTQSLLCYARKSGKPLWNTVIHQGKFEAVHDANTQASATAACDGERAYITFLNQKAIWLTALDLEGKILWQTEAGPFHSTHGYAASPVLYRSLAIVAGDSERASFLSAIHRQTGKVVWRIERPAEISFASPIVAHVAGKDQLLLAGGNRVASYEPLTGVEIWHCAGPATTVSSTMTYDGDNVFISGGYPEEQTMCIRADGTGDVTGTHVVWTNKQKFYVPSLAVHDGFVYAVNGSGIAVCFDAGTGKQLWKQRLGGDVSASPVVAGEHVYVLNEEGKTYVYRTGPNFDLVATNDLHDTGFATPTICGNRIYLRTGKTLYCIGNKGS